MKKTMDSKIKVRSEKENTREIENIPRQMSDSLIGWLVGGDGFKERSSDDTNFFETAYQSGYFDYRRGFCLSVKMVIITE